MLEVGARAPDFTATTDTGEQISLSSLRGKKVVLYFYPRDNTPGCTQEACDFRDREEALAAKGAVVLGVSTDSAASHEKFKAKHALPFTLLADPEKELVSAYGVYQEKKQYGRSFMGVVRTTFVIDADGVIANVFEKVKVKGHADAVLDSL
ncbi:MAG: thioredoxin-dependent thiol peroxidase [Chloroflexi bacterium]|nr:thioredoxin-dependent thiol peroxidase [Chloroflexota bacterium]MCH7655970.1 thioredoxin-dependent thiol peroxidase [Chloroflexota bacterium]